MTTTFDAERNARNEDWAYRQLYREYAAILTPQALAHLHYILECQRLDRQGAAPPTATAP